MDAEAPEPGYQIQHIDAHDDHEHTGNDLDDALERGGKTAAGAAAQEHAHQTQNKAYQRIGDHTAQVIPHGTQTVGLTFFGQALGKVDAAAHGDAVHGSDQADDEQHSVAHGAVCQLAGHQQVQHTGIIHQQIQGYDAGQHPYIFPDAFGGDPFCAFHRIS